ncbi:MAG: succinate dehydrogenase, cytochrome b556 subunit [Rhizobiaceae bacterium]|nr:succinate dehydrogenase, cytochrome b556 subunit [Rhizobiaceae bacterium]
MSHSPATRATTRARPLSPHLTIYRPPITMTMSIVHRITGGALYFGTLLIVWWLVAASASEAYFDFVNMIYGSWIGRLILLGYTWALLHHLLGGVRHLVWDTGVGLEKHTASKIAWATLAGSLLLTVLVWIAGYAARGGF